MEASELHSRGDAGLIEARQKAFGRGIFATPVDRASVSCSTLRPTPDHYACVCGAQPGGALELRFFRFQPLMP